MLSMLLLAVFAVFTIFLRLIHVCPLYRNTNCIGLLGVWFDCLFNFFDNVFLEEVNEFVVAIRFTAQMSELQKN